jgi:hypothetical protein
MPGLATTIVATTTTEVKLRPSILTKLRKELLAYQQMVNEKKALEAKMDKAKSVIGAIRDDTGEASLKVDGFTVTLVAGTSSKLDKKKLISLGCAAAWIEEATVTKPSRAYEKITCPGERDED